MATEGGPKLVSDGLVLALDAANPKEYLRLQMRYLITLISL